MSAIVHARVLENLARLRLGHVVERLDALLAEAARGEPTYLDFLDSLLRGEIDSKQRKRVAMGMTIAHFPSVKTSTVSTSRSPRSISDSFASSPPATSSLRRRMCCSSDRQESARPTSPSLSDAPSSRR